jgi:hypothetical protein
VNLSSITQENEKSRDILIEHRFHRTMIGSQGSKIREVRDLFPDVQINFPDPSKKSDVVTLRGPKNDVDKCHKYMQQLNQELVSHNIHLSFIRIIFLISIFILLFYILFKLMFTV